MKSSLLPILLLCICLLLTACKATDPDNLFEMPLEDYGDTTAPSADSVPEETIMYTGTYPYGNMQKSIIGYIAFLNNEVIFRHIVNGQIRLHCCDINTGEVQLYCEDATCSHKFCAAGNLGSNLEVYNGKLYGMAIPIDENQNGHYIAASNGNTLDYIVSANVRSFFHHEDKLYLETSDGSLMVLEEGSSEPRMVIEEYHGFWHVIFGEYLYGYSYDDTIFRVDLTAEEPKQEVILSNAHGITDGQHIYYVDTKTFQFYRCNMDGSDPQLLAEQTVLPASINFDDEYFYYRLYTEDKLSGNADSCDIYRFPKEDPTQTEKIVTLPVSAYQIFTIPGTGKLFVTTHAPQGEDRPMYIMGTDGSDVKMLEIPKY